MILSPPGLSDSGANQICLVYTSHRNKSNLLSFPLFTKQDVQYERTTALYEKEEGATYFDSTSTVDHP